MKIKNINEWVKVKERILSGDISTNEIDSLSKDIIFNLLVNKDLQIKEILESKGFSYKFFDKTYSIKEFQQLLWDFFIFYKNEFDNIGIKLWAHSGTLLGFMRHNGFIPWDDDIDVAMSYKDFTSKYEEIRKIVKYLDSYSNDPFISSNEDTVRILSKNNIKVDVRGKITNVPLIIDIMLSYPTSYSGKKLHYINMFKTNHGGLAYLMDRKLLWPVLLIYYPFVFLTTYILPIQLFINIWMFKRLKKYKIEDKEQLIYFYSYRDLFIKNIKEIDIYGERVYIPENYEEWLNVSFGNNWNVIPEPDLTYKHLKDKSLYKYWKLKDKLPSKIGLYRKLILDKKK